MRALQTKNRQRRIVMRRTIFLPLPSHCFLLHSPCRPSFWFRCPCPCPCRTLRSEAREKSPRSAFASHPTCFTPSHPFPACGRPSAFWLSLLSRPCDARSTLFLRPCPFGNMTSSEPLRALRTLSRHATPRRILHIGEGIGLSVRRQICVECRRGLRTSAHAGLWPVAVRTGPVGHRGYAQVAQARMYGGALTARTVLTKAVEKSNSPKKIGPMAEYDARVESGRLRDDEHQRSTICDHEEGIWKH